MPLSPAMKTNIGLATVAILLTLIIVADKGRKPPDTDARDPVAARSILDIRENQIVEIRVVDSRACIDIRPLVGAGSGEQSLRRLLTLIVGVRALRRFAPVPDLGPYGLQETNRRVEIVGPSRDSLRVLYLGDLTPTGNAMYARTEDRTMVLLVGVYFVNDLAILLRELQMAGIASVQATCPS